MKGNADRQRLGARRPSDYVGTVRTFNSDTRLILSCIICFNFAVMGVYNILLNLYLRRLGLGPETVGAMNSVYMAAMAVAAVPAGLTSSRVGNRLTMIAGFLIMICGSSMACLAGFFGMAGTANGAAGASGIYPLLVAAQALMGAGMVTFLVSCTPYMMAVTVSATRVHAFSVRSVTDGLFAFAGNAAGGFLPATFAAAASVPMTSPVPFRNALFMTPAALILGTFSLVRAGDDRRYAPDEPAEDESSADGDMGPRSSARRTAAAFLILALAASWFLIRCGTITANTFSNIYMDADLGISPRLVGTIQGLSQLAGMLAAFFVPFVVSRLGRRGCITVGILGSAAGYASLGVFTVPVVVAGSLLISRFMFVFMFSTFLMYGQEVLAHRYRSISSGVLYGIAGAAGALVTALGGLAAGNHGYRVVFVPAAALMVLGAVVFRASVGPRMRTSTPLPR